MTNQDLRNILENFRSLDILVVGDFFLDRYLIHDPDLAEVSIETGLSANQVVEIRNSPGAAGTVTTNLSALGVGGIRALGVIGKDGQAYDLKTGLDATGVDTSELIQAADRFTPTYTKPINKRTGAEGERMDIKNRTRLPAVLEDRIIESLRRLVPVVDGVIALDQVQEHNCGVLTDRVTQELNRLAKRHPDTICFADSRTRIDAFQNVILKPNREEALNAIAPCRTGDADFEFLSDCARKLARQNGHPVFVTLGPDGIIATDGEKLTHVPGINVPSPIDVVGAGDSVSAAVVSSLSAGASLADAALIGVLVSSITIQQLGTTGTASPQQIMERFHEISV